MNGFEIFCQYQAIKLHFTSPAYCYFKYNGKVNTTPAGFEKRKDKYMFHRLARNLRDNEVVGFFVSNFIKNNKVWTQDLVENEAMDTYRQWRKKYESLSYTFDQDMDKIVAELDRRDMGIASMFHAPQDDLPLIWKMMNQKEIEFETMVILHGLTGVLDSWDQKYSSDYIYEKTSKLIRKYEPFLGIDVPKFKEIVKRHLTVA